MATITPLGAASPGSGAAASAGQHEVRGAQQRLPDLLLEPVDVVSSASQACRRLPGLAPPVHDAGARSGQLDGALGGGAGHVLSVLDPGHGAGDVEQRRESGVLPVDHRQCVSGRAPKRQEGGQGEHRDRRHRPDQPEVRQAIGHGRQYEAVDHDREGHERNDGAQEVRGEGDPIEFLREERCAMFHGNPILSEGKEGSGRRHLIGNGCATLECFPAGSRFFSCAAPSARAKTPACRSFPRWR
jgi:hypothetical protein